MGLIRVLLLLISCQIVLISGAPSSPYQKRSTEEVKLSKFFLPTALKFENERLGKVDSTPYFGLFGPLLKNDTNLNHTHKYIKIGCHPVVDLNKYIYLSIRPRSPPSLT